MKFAFVIFKYFPYGGAQRDMMRIARACVARGHTVKIYTGQWHGDLPEPEIEIARLPYSGLFNHQRHQQLINAITRQLEIDQPDLVVGFNRMPGLDAYYAADPCFIERAHLERNWFYRLGGRYRFFADCERAIFSPDVHCEILLLSPNEKAVFSRWYDTPESRFHLVPPSLNSTRFAKMDINATRASVRTEFGLTQDDLLILLVGSGFRTKGLDRAIKGLASLPEPLRSRTHLLAIGQDNPRPYHGLASRLRIANHIQITTGRDDIPRLLQAADLLVHPAYRENTGLVLLEAMASSLPVLASDVCGYASYIPKANAGKLVPTPFSQHHFNQLLEQMLTSPNHEEWRVNGRQYAKGLMAANDGTEEAKMLEVFAINKVKAT
jgi:UDP-glucose:(heptosyl)LPS alpha-1,3-glucosyltransferase